MFVHKRERVCKPVGRTGPGPASEETESGRALQPASQPARRDERERWRCSDDPTQPSFRCNNAVPAFQDDVETGDAHLAWFFFYPARAPLYESGDPLPWIQ